MMSVIEQENYQDMVSAVQRFYNDRADMQTDRLVGDFLHGRENAKYFIQLATSFPAACYLLPDGAG